MPYRPIKIHLFFLVIVFLWQSTDFLAAQPTSIWGKAGEVWTPESILPDFSFAGYQRGEQPLPVRSPKVSITAYGAKPETDCTVAIQTAIDENPGQCIGIPAGKFIISDRLRIASSGTILQGAGERKTTLYFNRSLTDIDPMPAETGDGMMTSQWSWSGGLIVVGNDEAKTGGTVAITEPATRGANQLHLEATQELSVGSQIQLLLQDDETGSLTSYLYRENPGDAADILGHVRLQQVFRVTSIAGNALQLDRPLRTDILLAWKPVIRPFQSETENCGVEKLAIEFAASPYRGHWQEDGFNAIEIRGSHNWAREIEIRNCDSGIYVYGQFNTIDGVMIRSDRPPHESGNTGHHCLSALGQDCLITNFNIRTLFFHDLTLSRGSLGNVFSNGKGVDLCLDFHRYAPYENLLTDLDAGRGTRIWDSGGAQGKGKHSAAGTTFWNIDSDTPLSPPDEDFAPKDILFVGIAARDAGEKEPITLPGGWYYESRRPGRFQPGNLHLAQLQRRLKANPPPRTLP